jgi:hypothetical protein
MSYRLDIVKEAGYLRMTFTGPFSLDAARSAVDAGVEACKKENCEKVLFDCRSMTGDIDVLDRFDVGQYSASTVPHTVRIAVLGREDHILPDRFFENVVRNRGLTLTVFSDMDKAVEWLLK